MRQNPEAAKLSASVPSGRTTAVEVMNTMTVSGMRMKAMVRNCRFR